MLFAFKVVVIKFVNALHFTNKYSILFHKQIFYIVVVIVDVVVVVVTCAELAKATSL